MKKIRLDKFIADCGAATRSQAKKMIKQKRVSVGGSIVTDESTKVDEDSEDICLDGKALVLEKNIYIIMNKPQGVICATHDGRHRTVLDLIDEDHKGLFPAGRLDIDTEGLLILTNDGVFAHNTLSPKKHVTKKYTAHVSGLEYSEELKKAFLDGVEIENEYKCRPAVLEFKGTGSGYTVFSVEISEGKFHQVKKMFAAFGGSVIYLKRTAFGDILLDEDLKPGEYRRFNEKETEFVKKAGR